MFILYKSSKKNILYIMVIAIFGCTMNMNTSYTHDSIYNIIVQNIRYDEFDFYRDYAIVSKNNKKGLVDTYGDIVIPLIYDDVFYYHPDALVSVTSNTKYGIYDYNGKIVVPAIYEYASCMLGGKSILCLNGEWSLIDSSCNILISPQNYVISQGSSSNNLFSIIDYSGNGKWGVINSNGKILIECLYDYTIPYSDEVILVCKENKYGFINLYGDIIIDFIYDDIDVVIGFFDDLSWLKKGELWGCINSKCDEVVPFIFQKDISQFQLFYNGYSVVKGENGYGSIDKQGEILIPCEYDEIIRPFQEEGLIAIRKESKWGYADQRGNIVISLKYDVASQFSEYKAQVCQNRDWFIININGENIISLNNYDSTKFKQDQFRNGLLRVSNNGKIGLINYDGTLVIPCVYDHISYPYTEYVALHNNRIWSILQIPYNDKKDMDTIMRTKH